MERRFALNLLRQRNILPIVIGALLTVCFFVDLSFPLGVAGGVPYVLVVLLAAQFGSRRYAFCIALITSLLVVLGLYLSSPGGIRWIVLTNRFLALFIIWVTIYLFFSIINPIKAELAYKQKTLNTILDTVTVGIITIDTQGSIISVNKAVEKLFGYTASEVLGKNINIFMPEPYFSEHNNYIAKYLDTGKSSIFGKGREVLGKHKEGRIIPMDLSLNEFVLDGEQFFVGVLVDISEQKNLERELIDIVQEEQREIGQELHDGVGQEITGLTFYLEGLFKRLEQLKEKSSSNTEEIHIMLEMASRMNEIIASTGMLVKDLSRGLIPAAVNTGGLISALTNLAHKIDNIDGVDCSFTSCDSFNTFDVHTSTNLYKIAQEAVQNSLAHAQPKNIAINLYMKDNHPVMEISDDGEGVDSKYLSTGGEMTEEGMGLRIMRHRASIIGARLTIYSSPSEGTTIHCVMDSAMNTQ